MIFFPRSHARPVDRKAFTLVELMVVFSIIAVLAALLLSVTSRLSAAGERAKCLQNLRQLGAGFSSYMGDYNLSLPTPTDTGAIKPGAIAPTDWIFAIEPYVPYEAERCVYLCPANPARFKSDKVSTDRETNYAINYWMREGMTKSPMFRPNISPLTLQAPSRVGVLIDGNASWIKKEQPGRVTYAHGDSANVLFLDWHVQNLKKEELLDQGGKVTCMDQPDKIQ